MRVYTPRVTVAMITYNHERYVAEAISSILGQTYRDFELVIVDDGSTDRTPEVIHNFRDERIRYVHRRIRAPAPRGTRLCVKPAETPSPRCPATTLPSRIGSPARWKC